MTNHEDHFDSTIWDPNDPEQAIEDPFHGPEARLRLLSTPPYKNEDGTYYVFGGSYVCGTTDFDADGKPFIKFKPASSIRETMRTIVAHNEWIEKWQTGELPPYDEMGYPSFDFEAAPYLIIER